MKKLILMATVALLTLLPVDGHEHWRSGFTVDVSGDFTVDSGRMSYNWQEFWGTTVSGGYKWYATKGLFVKPEVTLSYENLDFDNEGWDGGDPYPRGRITHSAKVALGVSASVGYTIPVSRLVGYSVMTGPRYSYGINQHETTDKGLHNINIYSRSSLRWRFCLGVDIWRITVWGAYDVGLLNGKAVEYGYYGNREMNVVSIGLGYKF